MKMEQMASISIFSPTPSPNKLKLQTTSQRLPVIARTWAKRNALTRQLDSLPHPQGYWGPVFFFFSISLLGYLKEEYFQGPRMANSWSFQKNQIKILYWGRGLNKKMINKWCPEWSEGLLWVARQPGAPEAAPLSQGEG